MLDNDMMGAAEKEFRAAFIRLQLGTPEKLKEGTPVSQNNVAKEAGRDPSALRKSRYPALIKEIQNWIESNTVPNAEKETIRALKKNIAELNQRIQQLTEDRDLAQSLLVQAHDRIVVLSRQNERLASQLPPSNILKLDSILKDPGRNS